MEAGAAFSTSASPKKSTKNIDHISDINLPYTEHARRYLLSEGLRPETVIKTGSPMKEVLSAYAAQINDSEILENLKLEPGGYFVFSAHREENVDRPERLRILLDTLSLIAKIYGKPVIVSTHPRTKKRLDALGDCDRTLGSGFRPHLVSSNTLNLRRIPLA